MDVDLTMDTRGRSKAKKRKKEETPEESREESTTFDFTEKTWKEDFTLIVENRELFVAKNILAHASPVFEKMFRSDFKEKSMDERELPGKKFEDMRDFLRCIYPGVFVKMSHENVYRMLPLAEEYQVSSLKSKCEQFLISSFKDSTIEEVYTMLGLASTYNMEDLMKKCIEPVSEKPIEHLDCALERMSLPFNVMNDIKDKMVRRLEQGEWYEGAYRYVLSGMKRADKFAIEKCKGWTGISLKVPLTVSKMQINFSNPPKSKFMLFGIEVTYYIQQNYDCMRLRLSVEKDKLSSWIISLRGRLVLKCGTSKNEDFTSTFEMSFQRDKTDQDANINGGEGRKARNIFDVTEGFVYDGKINAEIHLLANRQKIDIPNFAG